ncbi:MAG: hypothetical protein AABY22_27300 [Nanoarchaeota archaeon]
MNIISIFKDFIIILLIGFIVSIVIIPTIIKYENKNLNGYYFHYFNDNEIGINMQRNMSMEFLRYIINHEVGHYVWAKCLQNEHKNQYKKLFKILTKNCKYKNNVEEDFADSYSYFMTYIYYFQNECVSKDEYFKKLSKIKLNCN